MAAPAPYTGDGYKSCAGYTRPITVWRQASYRPVFDSSYRYKLINTATGKALDVYGGSSSENATVDQWSYLGGTAQLFKIEVVGDSRWKLTAVHSGKAVVGTGTTSGSPVRQRTYSKDTMNEWGIDDHNGHFKIVNKGSKLALQIAAGNTSNGAVAQTGTWAGTANQDWDIVAVP